MNLHILHDGQQVGPFDDAALRARLGAGDFQPDDLCWHDGMTEWKSLRETYSDLFAAPSQTPPPLPLPPPLPPAAPPPSPVVAAEPVSWTPVAGSLPRAAANPTSQAAAPSAPSPLPGGKLTTTALPTGGSVPVRLLPTAGTPPAMPQGLPSQYIPPPPAAKRSGLVGCIVATLIAGAVVIVLGVTALYFIGKHATKRSDNAWDDSSASSGPPLPAIREYNNDTLPGHELVEQGDEKDTNQQHAEAVQAYQQAAAQGNVFGMWKLGYAYIAGEGIEKDVAKAFEWYHKAADLGLIGAQSDLGICYLNGEGAPKDEPLGLRWLRQAADGGWANAQSRLANIYLNGENGLTKNESQAFQWYHKAAEQGLPDAESMVGQFYLNGQGTAVDNAQAFEWFGKAAEQENAYAQSCLGILYMTGRGVTADYKQAFANYQKGADQNDPEGQAGLGFCYLHGLGVQADNKQALEWMQKAADQEQDDGTYGLGLMYEFGYGGLTADPAKAMTLLTKVDQMDNGHHADAANAIGILYRDGLGVPRDYALALTWFKRAAVANIIFWFGRADALNNLGYLNENGLATAKDLPVALMYYNQSAALGNPDAKKNQARLQAAGVVAATPTPTPTATPKPSPTPTPHRAYTPRPTPRVIYTRKRR